jgi:hypothetical protein
MLRCGLLILPLLCDDEVARVKEREKGFSGWAAARGKKGFDLVVAKVSSIRWVT